MRTALDCLPCLLKQGLFTTRLSTADPARQQLIMAEVAKLVGRLDQTLSPPENSVFIYRLVAQLSGCADPYARLKKESNLLAASLLDRFRTKVDLAEEPLLAACKIAIAGNVIDYGTQHGIDATAVMETCLEQPLAVNDYDKLAAGLTRARDILYLADNCGEIVLDLLVIERLQMLGKKVVLAVRESPIINDASLAEAREIGLDRNCAVISNGTGCPGTPLPRCSPAFQKAFRRADLIISKGQGNFETLSETPGPVYFLLTVKCPVVGRHLAENFGAAGEKGARVLMKSNC